MTTNRAHHTIDATGQTLGRLASRAVTLLRGKQKPTFTPHIDAGDFVHITNLRGVRFTGTKFTVAKHHRYSGYPGGLKTEVLRDRWAKSPERVLRLMVSGMLPVNRTRSTIVKRLRTTW
ncbi:50S ribosomal protein L13 [Candidatus Uhrbacteria bacterium]|nr:50S ribosomal protein L13 [Candidatus Uhrbacteria bacterium]